MQQRSEERIVWWWFGRKDYWPNPGPLVLKFIKFVRFIK